MAATQNPPLGPHILPPPTLPPPQWPRPPDIRPYSSPPSQSTYRSHPGHPYPLQPRGFSQAPATPGAQSRRQGAAPLSNLLHSEPHSPVYSKSPISPRERMQISPRTILQSEVHRDNSFESQPNHPPRYEKPGALQKYSPREEQNAYVASPSSNNVPSHPSPTNSYTSHASSTPYTHPAPTTKSSEMAIGRSIPPTPNQSRYRLAIRQQPVAARACGHGERDRRVIDPPPILQLTLADYDPDSSEDADLLRWPFNVILCTLYSVPHRSSVVATGQDVTTIPDPNNAGKETRRLMGTLVANPFVGIDPDVPASKKENARLGCFFIFHDLSCRQNGLYKLRFSLSSISVDMVPAGSTTSVLASIDSDVFEVFSAKDFPGMRASTSLTKELKRQGATVAVKKGNEGKGARKGKKRGSTETGDSGSDVSDDEEGGNAKSSKGKKRKP